MRALPLIILFLSGCASNQYTKQKKVINVDKTITVDENSTFDGNGMHYLWVGTGNCSQREGMPPMFVLLPGAILKNLSMENAPDGIHIKGSNVTIDGITNIDVCEDAISISKSKRFPVGYDIKIRNSKFYKCEDKGLQLTRGQGILIENNEFYDCSQAVRIKQDAKDIIVRNNKFVKSKNALRVTGGEAKVRGNSVSDCEVGLWAEKGGVIQNLGRNQFFKTKEPSKETDGGKITNN